MLQGVCPLRRASWLYIIYKGGNFMKVNRIITISRTYGSGGREIGEKLAKELDIPFYDKNLLHLMSEKTGISEEGLMNADEKLLNRFTDPYDISKGADYSTSMYLFKVESKLIVELADKGRCVIVGRLADWILKDRVDVLKVFITAPEADRINRIMKYENVSAEQAEKLMKQVDKLRNHYYSYFTDKKWQDPKYKDIILNSSLLGIDGTVAVLKSMFAFA